ncbi:MAG: glycosyltransferase family 39 protein [Abditibacteriota bacterium]|nr:glycosyltransferase family 39 protein [Abditibacteriota bacterium]
MFYLGAVPSGIHEDEAYAGYHAWCLLNGGVDCWGYRFPMYFISCGGGMNALESYLMIPFVALMGLTPFAIRLPQAIIGCLSLPIFYLLLKKMYGPKAGVIGMFILAVCPWHIMMCRWALESNLAPAFLLAGFYLFLLGCEKPKFLLLSALVYGLELYTYSATWIAVIPMLVLMTAYGLWTKKIRFDGYLMGAACIFLLFLLPVILFTLVNTGHIEPIRTAYFSVPKLVHYRGGEVAGRLLHKILHFGMVMIAQRDRYAYNGVPGFGMYYLFALPFVLLGLWLTIRKVFTAKKEFTTAAPLLIWFAAAVCLGCVVDAMVHRMNMIHFCNLILITLGVSYAAEAKREVGAALAIVYVVSFSAFTHAYFTTWNRGDVRKEFLSGFGEAIRSASRERKGDIYIAVGSQTAAYEYMRAAFYMGMPCDELRKNIRFANYPAPYLMASELGRYKFDRSMSMAVGDAADREGAEPGVPNRDTYIIFIEDKERYEKAGYTIEPHDMVAVAYR